MSIRKAAIDFRPARGFETNSRVYSTLISHNGRRNRKDNPASIMANAFDTYDPDEPEMITESIELSTAANLFAKTYNIKTRTDIFKVLVKEPEITPKPLREPSEKLFSFHEDDSEQVALLEYLDTLRYRDRGIAMIRILRQYMARGNDPEYNKYLLADLITWLRKALIAPESASDPFMDTVIDMIEVFAKRQIDANDPERVMAECNQRLREFMGVA